MTVLPDDGLELAAEFPDVTHEQWQRLVAGVLRKAGKDVEGDAAEEALSTQLEDGLRTRPLYTARDTAPEPGLPGFAPFVRGGRAEGNTVGGWDIRQRHTVADRDTVLADLENGVTSLWLVAGEGGIPVPDLGTVLDGVYLDLAPVVLDAGADTEPAARELLRLYEERGVAAEAARGNLGADPLGHEARTGRPGDLAPAAELARLCAGTYPGLRALTVDALPYHEAGGSAAQELGASLATAVAYLRELTEAGLSVEQACAQLEFRYAATADQFLTIAKLRAARRLVGEGRRGVRRAPRGSAGPARGDLAGDDDAPRPVGEHAAHHRGDAGRRGGRRGLRDRAAVRPRARAAGRVSRAGSPATPPPSSSRSRIWRGSSTRRAVPGTWSG
ncbi:methylmalonyl-CoA mutase small subunit [Streptomyces sp. e14]|nr:methylmalonyl-CoA mutase small subunit [Streptomyces sp. e14]